MTVEYGSWCPTCKKAVHARKEVMSGLLTHEVVVNGRKEQHWWGATLGTNEGPQQSTITEHSTAALKPWLNNATRGAFGFCRTCGVSVPVERRGENYVHEFTPGIFHVVNNSAPRHVRKLAVIDDVKEVSEEEWHRGAVEFAGWDEAYTPLAKPKPEEDAEDER